MDKKDRTLDLTCMKYEEVTKCCFRCLPYKPEVLFKYSFFILDILDKNDEDKEQTC